MFPNVKKNKKLYRGVGGHGGWCETNPSFSRIFEFFLTWQDPLACYELKKYADTAFWLFMTPL